MFEVTILVLVFCYLIAALVLEFLFSGGIIGLPCGHRTRIITFSRWPDLCSAAGAEVEMENSNKKCNDGKVLHMRDFSLQRDLDMKPGVVQRKDMLK